jgi:23S rRNA (uracil1939-C5)-methyltransferase
VYEYALAAADGEWAYQGLGDSGQHRRSKPLHYTLMAVDLQFYPEDFVQVNAALNEQMVEMAMDWLALTPNDRVLDLFCGIGNFTLPMAQKVEQVLGVEGLKHQVDQASANARQAGISNAQFILGDLFKPMSEQGWFNTGAYTKLLMDPGRQGAFDLVKTIGRLGVERMVYVSCNPSTLARDLPFILQAGYRVSKIAGLDVFPQTHHLEMMLLLTRK